MSICALVAYRAGVKITQQPIGLIYIKTPTALAFADEIYLNFGANTSKSYNEN